MCMASEGILYIQLTENLEPDGSAWYRGTTKKRTAAALQPQSGMTLKDSAEGKSSQWAELWAVHLVVPCVWSE